MLPASVEAVTDFELSTLMRSVAFILGLLIEADWYSDVLEMLKLDTSIRNASHVGELHVSALSNHNAQATVERNDSSLALRRLVRAGE